MLRIFIPVLVLFALSACLDLSSGCDHTILKRAIAPDGNAQVVRLLIDCGATTTSSSSLRMIAGKDTVSFGKPEDTILPEAAGVDFYWKSSDTLIVKGLTKESMATAKRKWPLSNNGKTIFILYEYE